MPGVVFTNGDTISVNLDKSENPSVSGDVISSVGLKFVKFYQYVNDTAKLLDSVALNGQTEYKFNFTPSWKREMKAILVQVYDTRNIGYVKALVTDVFLSPAPQVSFMATSLDVNPNAATKPTISGTVTSALGLVSVKYYMIKGTEEETFGTEVTFLPTDSVKSYEFKQTPTEYAKTVTGFKVVATDSKNQVTQTTLPIAISPVAITFDKASLTVNNRLDEQTPITASVSSDANLVSIKVYRIDSISSKKTVKETQVAEIISFTGMEYKVNITDFPYTNVSSM
jgi:hypothetical protein